MERCALTRGHGGGDAGMRIETVVSADDASAAGLVAAVREVVRSYVRGAPPVDDFTLLVVERRSVMDRP